MEQNLRIIDRQHLIVGESPLWDEERGILYTVDIRGKCIRVLDWASGAVRQIDLPQQVGCIALTEDGTLLAAMEDGVYLVAENGLVERFSKPVRILGRRFNDGKAGPDGRFYVGTTDVRNEGAFYRMDGDGTMTKLLDHVGVSNGLAWSADGKTMYFCDSPRAVVEAFDFCAETGTLSNRRSILDMPFDGAVFDGMTIDAEDKLWVAVWDGACVLRIDPEAGKILSRIDVPTPRSSCCIFAGGSLHELIITSAAYEREEEPHGGNTFAVTLPVAGRAGYRFQRK